MYKFLVCFFLPFSVHAFNVDSMVKYYDKEDFFIVTGDKKGEREYIYTTISELTKINERDVEINFSSSAVSSWPILTEPSDIVLGNGEQVKVKIDKIYQKSGDDRIFGITFTPDLINSHEKKNYNIGFGYKVWMIVLGDSPLRGDMSVARGNMPGDYIVKNNTNKVLEVNINYCGDERRLKSCQGQLFLRPGGSKKAELGSKARNAVFSFYSGGDNNKPLKKINL